MRFDLIVIGMGLSGLMAAKTATEAGARVLIAGKGVGGLWLFSNTIDLLGTLPAGMSMAAGLDRWLPDHPDHPYARIGRASIDEAVDAFRTFFPPPYAIDAAGDGNRLVPTGVGRLRPTYLVPETMRNGLDLCPERTLLTSFLGFRDFSPEYAAAELGCRGVHLVVPQIAAQSNTATALARLLETPAFREAVAAELRRQLQGETHVGFPALLGLNDPIGVLHDLEERAGVKIFEIPVLPPSLPGMRIFNRFRHWLIGRGATFLLGNPVQQVLRRNSRCTGIEVHHPPVSQIHEADRLILATGRFMGGGLASDEEKLFEPLLGIPVAPHTAREHWFERSFFGEKPHAIHQSGILTDGDLRPLDDRGKILSDNLWAAGTILAGHACIDEKSREGIEIATGYWAARKALTA